LPAGSNQLLAALPIWLKRQHSVVVVGLLPGVCCHLPAASSSTARLWQPKHSKGCTLPCFSY
jgi:hypothetical protein